MEEKNEDDEDGNTFAEDMLKVAEKYDLQVMHNLISCLFLFTVRISLTSLMYLY